MSRDVAHLRRLFFAREMRDALAPVMDLRERLSHVVWIGGGPQAGKTTLSRLLAGKWDLKIYNLDWHSSHADPSRRGSEARAFIALSMDERWAVPGVDEMLERSIRIWEAGFRGVIEDLLQLPRDRIVVAEGPGAFPWCVAPLLTTPQQAIFLVPTAARRVVVAERRWGIGQVERLPGIVDRERAIAKLAARDVLLDARIRASCAELGLRCEDVDGTRDLDASLALLEEQFASYLPATLNV